MLKNPSVFEILPRRGVKADTKKHVNITTIAPEEGTEYYYNLTCSDSYDYNATSDNNPFTSFDYFNITLDISQGYLAVNMPVTISGKIDDYKDDTYQLPIDIYLDEVRADDPWIQYTDWFDLDWKYRIPINIDNYGQTLENYQINLTINTSGPINDGNMNDSCSDIRFADINKNEIKYWIENESLCNTSSTPIWILMKNLYLLLI